MPTHIDYPDAYRDEVIFPELINAWRNEGLGQYFMDEKKASNETRTWGTVAKHQRALNPHGPFTVPCSLDGFSRRKEEYIPVALVCHHGPNHFSGHYYTILVYRGLLWSADDGRHPGHCIQTSVFRTPREIAWDLTSK